MEEVAPKLCKYCNLELPKYDHKVTAMLQRYHRRCYTLKFEELMRNEETKQTPPPDLSRAQSS